MKSSVDERAWLPSRSRSLQLKLTAAIMSFNRNKALPELPLDCTNGFEEMLALSSPSAESASSNSKALPAIRIEETLSTEEMDHLRDKWNRSFKGTVS